MARNNHNESVRTHVVRSFLAASLALAALLQAPAAAALDTGDIVVASLKGEVHVSMKGAERAVKAGSVLELPATVRTGRDGAIELRQGATSVSVGPDTLLEFPALALRGGPIDRIVQPQGNAFYSIGKREGRKLRVETPFLVGVVKGTQFNVAVQASAATISLFEGLLDVRAADDSSAVDLRAGEIASRKRGDNGIGVLKMNGNLPPRALSSPGVTKNVAPAPELSLPVRANVPVAQESDALLDRERPVSITTPESVGVPAVSVPVAVETRVEVDVPAVADSGSAAVDVGVSTPDAGGAVTVDLGAAADVGGAAAVDLGASASVDAGAGAGSAVVDVGVSAGNVAVDTSANVSVDVPAGNVDLGVSVGGVDLGAAVDLGLDDDVLNGKDNEGKGNGNETETDNDDDNGKGKGKSDDVTDLLDTLLKNPGKKK